MPLTANDRLVLVRVKVERAKKHLRDLAAEILVTDKVVVVTSQVDSQIAIPEGFVKLPRMSSNVMTISGDIVHNLRSALDHLAHQLVIVGSGKEPSRKIEFPIAKDFASYESEKARKVEGMRPEAIKAIDALRPYRGGNDTLWRIHELDNIDKHRTLFTVAHDYIFFADWLDAGDFWLKTNAPNFSGVFDAQVENEVQLEIDKALGQPKVAGSNSLLPTLHQMVDFVDGLVANFLPLL